MTTFSSEAEAFAYDAMLPPVTPARHGNIRITSEELRNCAAAGMSIRQTASLYGAHWNTIYLRAKAEGIEFRSERPRLSLSEYAACTGMTAAEAASHLGVKQTTIYSKAKEFGLSFAPAKRGPKISQRKTHDPRADEMAARYQAGETLEQIGQSYAITRERVRQLIKKYHGLTGSDGGKSAVVQQRKAKRREQLNTKCLAINGCTLDQLHDLRRIGKELMAQGHLYSNTPIGVFKTWRHNTKPSGPLHCGSDLTFWQWWTIWQQSGKWDERGRGSGAWMSRRDKTKPFSVDNAFISTHGDGDRYSPRKEAQ